MNEIRTSNFTAVDVFNAATAKPLKSAINQKLNITGVYICERADLDGVVRTVANLKTEEGAIYGTISDTVIRSVEALPEMLETNGSIAIKVEERDGKAGRTYLVITLVG